MRKGTVEQFFAITPPGLETVCAEELRALDLPGIKTQHGGVEFAGGLRELYLAHLWIRSASRIVVRLGSFRCRDFPDLFRLCVRLPWGRFVKPDQPLRVRASSRASRLQHTGRLAETVEAAIKRALGGQGGGLSSDEQALILIRLEDDHCTLSIDASGPLLHRRGYREEGGVAPLRENLAAGILLHLGWCGNEGLFDPLCGSGTFALEAALLAARIPSGARRNFAFMAWPGYRHGLWTQLCREAGKKRQTTLPLVVGSDIAAEAITAARRNAVRAEVDEMLELDVAALAETPSRAGPGLLICNPPYGERIGKAQGLLSLYRQLGGLCREKYDTWRWAVLTPDDDLIHATGLPLRRTLDLSNGGIRVGLYVGQGEKYL